MIKKIELILQAQNLTSSQFADRIGVPRSVMSHVLAGRNNPSLDFVTKILRTFPEIRPQWLMFGEGKMYDNLTAVGQGTAAQREEVLDQLGVVENEDVWREMPTEDGAQVLPNANETGVEPVSSVAANADKAADAPNVAAATEAAAPNVAAASTPLAPVETQAWPKLPDDFVPMNCQEPALLKVVFFYADGHFEAYAPPREN